MASDYEKLRAERDRRKHHAEAPLMLRELVDTARFYMEWPENMLAIPVKNATAAPEHNWYVKTDDKTSCDVIFRLQDLNIRMTLTVWPATPNVWNVQFFDKETTVEAGESGSLLTFAELVSRELGHKLREAGPAQEAAEGTGGGVFGAGGGEWD